MLKTLFTQTSWSLLGTVFGFVVGFFVKMFLVNKVGASDFGLYTIGQSLQSAVSTMVALGIPAVILKFLPKYLTHEEITKANILTSKSLTLLLFVGIISCMGTMLLSSLVATYIFKNSDLSLIIMISALYIPLSLYSAYITSVYRSLLKIKEIIMYGTIYMVTFRAVLTFAVYSFSSNIIYFLWIELISMLLSITLLTYKFQNNKLKLYSWEYAKENLLEAKEIYLYAKTMYANSVLGFASGYTLMFIMSITLPASSIGVFAILMTLAGLTNFLQANINRVFAPIISSLVSKKDYTQLSMLYRESTFLLNIITIPFILIVVLFSKDILMLYGEEFSGYTLELTVLFLANYFSLMVGSSGMMMVMGGLEKEQLYLQVMQVIITIIVSIVFLPIYGLMAAVLIRLLNMFFINQMEIYFIRKKFSIWPWDKSSYFLILSFFTLLYVSYTLHKTQFSLLEYILLPISVYAIFFTVFHKKLITIKQLIQNKDH